MKKRIMNFVLPLAAAGAALCALMFCACEGHEHSFADWDSVTLPTCTESGSERSLCECGATNERDVAPLGHVWGERRETKSATCVESGKFVIECTRCGELLEQGRLDKLGLELVRHEAKSATCRDVGWDEYENCERCNYTTYSEVAKISHTPTAAPDCVTAQTCKVCGEVLRDALGHREKAVPGKSATCKSEGLSEGKVCSVCDTVLLEQIKLPKLPHTEKLYEGRVATCKTSGVSDSLRCSVCAEVIAEAVEIPLRAHSYGGSLDRECDECGFMREVGADACIHENQATVKKSDSTCGSYGLTQGVSCEDCGEILVQREVIEPKEHTERTLKGYGAACDIAGLSEGRACSRCGLVTEAQELISAVGHRVTEIAAVAPDCEKSGLTAGAECAVCALVIVKQNTVSPTGHAKIYHEGRNASCGEDGWLAYYTCKSCDYSTYEPLAAKKHAEVKDAAVLATCTESGLSEGRHCALCGEVTLPQVSVAPLGHTFGTWHRISTGGCADTPISLRVCGGCLHIELDRVSPHSFKTAVKSPTCTAAGEVTVFCSLCGVGSVKEELKPLGHDLVWSVTDDGHSEKCERLGCGYAAAAVSHRKDGTSKCEDGLCADCGYLMREGVGHKLSPTYKSDGEHHWNECTAIGCDYVENKSPHQNENALCTDKNVRCRVCMALYSPNVAHKMGDWYELQNGSVRKDCALCDYYETKLYD